MSTLQTPAHPLDRRVKTAWRLQAAAWLVLPLLLALAFAGFAGFTGLSPWASLLTLAAIAATMVLALVVAPEVRYRRWRWEVREEEIRLREGLIVISHTVIPMVRVQHVDTSQGPIMRALGLSDVHVWTAANKHTIPALSDEHAADLRDRIATLARVTDDGGL